MGELVWGLLVTYLLRNLGYRPEVDMVVDLSVPDGLVVHLSRMCRKISSEIRTEGGGGGVACGGGSISL